MTKRHCRVCDDWHDLDDPWPHNCIGHFGVNYNRSSLASPMVIKDGIDAIQSQLTGKWYDSKSSLRSEYKVHGMIEIGNEAPKAQKLAEHVRVTADDIGRAYQKVASGYKPSVPTEAVSVGSTGSEWH